LRYQDKVDDPHSSHAIILSRAGDGRGKRLLDVGSAQGVLAERFGARGFEVVCIEGDPGLAATAAGRCRQMIIANLDQPVMGLTGTFDVIVLGDVLEHLQDPLQVLRDLLRYLKPDGKLIVSVPNIAHLFIRLNLLVGRFEYTDRGILDRTHLRFFTRRSFRQLLEEASVVVDEVTASAVPLFLVWPGQARRGWLRASHRLNGYVARHWSTMFGYQFIAVARREKHRHET